MAKFPSSNTITPVRFEPGLLDLVSEKLNICTLRLPLTNYIINFRKVEGFPEVNTVNPILYSVVTFFV